MAKIINSLALHLLAVLKTSTADYCTLESGIESSIVAKDGSFLSILQINGQTKTSNEPEYVEGLQLFATDLQALWRTSGYQMTTVYLRDTIEEPIIKKIEDIKLSAAAKFNLDFEAVIKESSKIMAESTMMERCYIALWTRPSLILDVEKKIHSEQVKETIQETGHTGTLYGQSTLGINEGLRSKHEAYVKTVLGGLSKMNISADLLDVASAVREIRNVAFPLISNTNFVPHSLGNIGEVSLKNPDTRIGWKTSSKTDSSVLPKSFNEQIMVMSAEEGVRKGKNATTIHDETMVKVGGRTYAPLTISVPPKTNPSHLFNILFHNLSASNIKERPLPYSIAITMESDGISGMVIKQLLSKILAIASAKNKLILDRTKDLMEIAPANEGQIIKLKMSAMTWHECDTPEDIRTLTVLKMRLWRGLESWGSSQVVENTGDAVEAWASSCLALSHKNVGSPCPMPFMSAAKFLPLTRPASPFPNGNILYKTLDGKILPYSLFAPNQNSWVSMFAGNMGSGKSVTLSSRVEELVLHSLNQCGQLPYTLIADIGETSRGSAENIASNLPPDMRHLVSYRRIQNSKADSVNPLDTAFSMREPIPRDLLFMASFVTALITPAENKGEPEKEMSSFVTAVIKLAFKQMSDKNPKGNPQQYRYGLDPVIDKALNDLEVDLGDSGSKDCWALFDIFFAKGMYREAELVQRYAVPTLNDLTSMSSMSEIQENYATKKIDGESITQVFQRGVNAAITEYPAFAERTKFDAGVSRLLFLDLSDVAPKSQSLQVKKQAGLFYQMARQLFVKKIGFHESDLPDKNSDSYIEPEYSDYYRRLIKDLTAIPKGMFFDEFHRGRSVSGLVEQIEGDVRESRKWMLMIDLYSQDMSDFEGMTDFASSWFFMEKGSEATRMWAKANLALTDTELATMVRYCNGAGSEGAPYFAKFKTEKGDFSTIMVSKLGPKRMWSLSSNANDRSLRNQLVQLLGRSKALEVLALEFPSGNCKKALEEMGSTDTSSGEANSLIERLVNRITAKYK